MSEALLAGADCEYHKYSICKVHKVKGEQVHVFKVEAERMIGQ